MPFRVVGVSAKKGAVFGKSLDEFVVIPLGAYQKLFGARQSLALMVKPRDADAGRSWPRTKRASRCASSAASSRGEPDNFGIVASDSVLGIFQQATAGIAVVLVGIVGLSLLVGGIVIMNIMLMVVSERTREIGLRKALGAKRRDIMSQVLTESITLSMIGGIVGIALGALFSTIISALTPVPSAVETVVGGARRDDHGAGRPVLRLVSGAPRRHARSRSKPCGGNRPMSAFTKQLALLRETAEMAFDTLRGNKMRSALTVLGVVIGVTSIVGMTSLIRGFDTSLRDSINSLGPNTIFVQRFGAAQLLVGRVVPDADAPAGPHGGRRRGDRAAGADGRHGRHLARRRRRRSRRRSASSTAASARGRSPIMGTTEQFVDVNFAKMFAGPLVHRAGSAARAAPVAVIGYGPYEALFEKRGIDPIGKQVRIGAVDTPCSA